MGQKWGALPLWRRGAGSPPNTMWPGPRPTCMRSFILIRPTVWPQCTNVTDRQDRQDKTGQDSRLQRSDSIGRTVLQTVAQKSNKFFQSYDHKCTATFFMNHSVYLYLVPFPRYCQSVTKMKRHHVTLNTPFCADTRSNIYLS